MIKKSQITGITGWVRSCSSWYFEASGAFRSHTATLCQSLPAKCCADCENHLPATFQPFQLDRCLKKWVGPGVILMKAYESYYSVSLSYISYIHKYIYIYIHDAKRDAQHAYFWAHASWNCSKPNKMNLNSLNYSSNFGLHERISKPPDITSIIVYHPRQFSWPILAPFPPRQVAPLCATGNSHSAQTLNIMSRRKTLMKHGECQNVPS